MHVLSNVSGNAPHVCVHETHDNNTLGLGGQGWSLQSGRKLIKGISLSLISPLPPSPHCSPLFIPSTADSKNTRTC